MRRTHSLLLIAMLLAGCLGAADEADPDLGAAEAELARARDRLGPLPGERIAARGAFSCDFTLDFTAFTEPVGPVITRDRVLMQRFALEHTNPDEPGMLQKHIPFFATSETTALAGGRYLFQGRRQAAQYERFVTERFEYPEGTQFLDRPEFRDPECRDWTVLSARRFSGLDTHTVLRTERFDTGLTRLRDEVRLARAILRQVPALTREAHARGYAELQVLHNLQDHEVQLVYMHPRVLPPSLEAPDGAAFGAIAGAPALGEPLVSALGIARVYDQSHSVLTIWQPYAPGDTGAPALWPNSPPFPAPSCGDGVCSLSRGEDAASCGADCGVDCGDLTCQPGESPQGCPTDCEVPLSY
ncbi:MAG: hypothetical protein RLP09_35185 [Sandaracinaceae bacterium]